MIIGGGAGLSAAAGLFYTGKRFTDHFGPFIDKYGFSHLYTSSFYPFKMQEEKWAYWSRHIHLNRYATGPTKLYRELYHLVSKKAHHVITTNVESQFEKAGFSPLNIFEVQGNYSYLQCAKGCHNKLYDNESLIEEMIATMIDCAIPSYLVPKCPVCGGDMDPNLRSNRFFVQDEQWLISEKLYRNFLEKFGDKRIVFMELGVGFNTPEIIRYPFEQMTYNNANATLLRLNRDHSEGVVENIDRTIAFVEDMHSVIVQLTD
ncbi:Sir2 family NAD-dependent protein deacetylase [Bacillus pumilus]|uniref:Sir2 family NAD-dependent protein deacetylase n=1 Tax=Bacillus pumilus TaxID=1408 RepID=UPI003C30162D